MFASVSASISMSRRRTSGNEPPLGLSRRDCSESALDGAQSTTRAPTRRRRLPACRGRSYPTHARGRRCVALPADRHDGHQHRCDKLLLPMADGEDIARAHRNRAAGLRHAPSGDEQLALPRREEVHLVLDGQHLRARQCQSHRSIATGRIADRAHDTAVEEVVLLTDPAAERHFDLHLPGGHAAKRRTDRRVEALPRKARPDPALEIGIGHFEDHPSLLSMTSASFYPGTVMWSKPSAKRWPFSFPRAAARFRMRASTVLKSPTWLA